MNLQKKHIYLPKMISFKFSSFTKNLSHSVCMMVTAVAFTYSHLLSRVKDTNNFSLIFYVHRSEHAQSDE